jgi:hypothetical protein
VGIGLGVRWEWKGAYGVAADGGDYGFADASDVLPIREELVGIHFGDCVAHRQHPNRAVTAQSRTGLVLHLLNVGARCPIFVGVLHQR